MGINNISPKRRSLVWTKERRSQRWTEATATAVGGGVGRRAQSEIAGADRDEAGLHLADLLTLSRCRDMALGSRGSKSRNIL